MRTGAILLLQSLGMPLAHQSFRDLGSKFLALGQDRIGQDF
jgi:hypothetical protein